MDLVFETHLEIEERESSMMKFVDLGDKGWNSSLWRKKGERRENKERNGKEMKKIIWNEAKVVAQRLGYLYVRNEWGND